MSGKSGGEKKRRYDLKRLGVGQISDSEKTKHQPSRCISEEWNVKRKEVIGKENEG